MGDFDGEDRHVIFYFFGAGPSGISGQENFFDFRRHRIHLIVQFVQ